MNDNLSHSFARIKIACNSGAFRCKKYLHEGRIVHFRKAPARLFWEIMQFPDGIQISQMMGKGNAGTESKPLHGLL